MKLLKLLVHQRQQLGSNRVQRIRKSGIIPSVIYGQSGCYHITIKNYDFINLMKSAGGSAFLIDIKDNQGKSYLAILKHIQRDAMTDKVIHIDFHEISSDKEIITQLSIKLIGESIGVKSGNGILDIVTHILNVRCLPKDLPEFITVDVTNLQLGESLHLKDLTKIQGVYFLNNPDIVIVTCKLPIVLESK